MVEGLRDDLAAAIAEVEAPEVEPKEVETPEVEAPEPKADRARGPDGKFVAKDAAEPAPEAEEEAPAEPAPQEPEEDKAAPEKPATAPDAISRWSAADKEMFKGIPKPAQDFLLRRHKDMEADYTKRTAAIADFRKNYEPVDQLFTPFKQQMAQQGWTPATLVKAWADVERDLMGGKGADVVARMIRDYKVDPYAVAGKLGIPATGAPTGAAGQAPQEPQGDQPQFDPQVEKLLEAKFGTILSPLQQQLKALNDEANARAQAHQMQRMQGAQQTLQTFIDAKDKDGNPAHPHYAEVENDMVALARIEAQAGRQPDLARIYDQAVWANPSTREKLLAAQQAAQAAKAQQEARAKAVAAKKAAVSVSGAPGSGQPPKPQKGERSLRDELEDAMSEHEAA